MRALARWGITPLLAAPVGAWALGLGDIELQSALNQPFRAEIVLSATPDELQGLRVMLASPDTFQRYGLDRPGFLNNLEFRIVAQRGRSVIAVSSRESIVEPFVTLLLEATWPRGRTLREYTVLLDPPVLLPAPSTPPVVQPAETRSTSPNTSGGPINRPAAPPPPSRAEPAPTVSPRPPSAGTSSTAAPSSSGARSASATGGVYGPVQRAETLWGIADRLRPDGVTVNQMMIAIYQASPEAFGGNINLLRAGASLRLPDAAVFDTLAVTAANAEVRRQTDEWTGRAAQGGQLRLLPPAETAVTRTPAPPPPSASTQAAAGAAAAAAAAAGVEESRRLLELRNRELQNIQQAEAATEPPPAPAESAAPGVELEAEQQLFADEIEADTEPAETPAPTPVPVPAPVPVDTGPSLMSQIMGYVLSPLLWIALGLAALVFTALWFVRRRRDEQPRVAELPDDVTGRWDALESEVDSEEEVREPTARLSRHLAEDTIVVEEQHDDEPTRPSPAPPQAERRPAAARPQQPARPAATDETLSSQTVINLDQADAVAEADFHIAYGLYDQAAELVQKALDAQPDRRDLKLKLLEVFFMWGNKDAFLKAAQGLRGEIGQAEDPDWDKVVIMGRQVCPDERLFTEAKTGGGHVDVDLEAGDSPLDLAFDESVEVAGGADAGLDFSLEASDERPAPKPAAAKSGKPAPARDLGGDSSLDIGARTAAGLEAALFDPQLETEDDGSKTTPDLAVDTLAVTQESPTIERRGGDFGHDNTIQLANDAPTVETPTIEGPAAKSMATKTIAIPRSGEPPTVEQPAFEAAPSDFTAEIDLDDLGLDVKDMEELPGDLGDLPMASGHTTDTSEQPALAEDDGLLSATGVTRLLPEEDDEAAFDTGTAVLEDQDATLLAPGFDEGTSTMTGTAVLDGRHEVDDETGSTSLVKSLKGKGKDGVDLDLADLTAALQGADTVEQPRAFSHDVFGEGDTPVDLDIGNDLSVDDDPTGTEEVGPLDPQTMTEVGTKLDLARAYIDMGDPEGARSILEEVLDEGDPSQRREAQGLIDVLSA